MSDGSVYFDASEEAEYPRYVRECGVEVVEHTSLKFSYQPPPREPSRQLGFSYFDTSAEAEYPRYFCEEHAEVVEHTSRELS